MAPTNVPPPARDAGDPDEADEFDTEYEDGAADDEIFFLDESETWALWLPVGVDEGVVVHAHGAPEDGDDGEYVFFECEIVDGPDGEALVACTECDATIRQSEIEALIEGLA